MEEANNLQQRRRQLQQVVFRRAYEKVKNPYSREVFKQLMNCHTATQGMHRLRCSDSNCLHEHYQYHNCGNRHCPNCGGMRREQWLEDKTSELLPTSYFHCVFTVPHELNALTMGNRKQMYDLLFEASSYTLLKLANDPKWMGATPGIISILHTWGQDLSFHPHVHCIVSGGGIQGEKWVVEKRKNHTYLFPRSSMEKIYKAYYLKRLRWMLGKNQLKVTDQAALEHTLNDIEQKRWNVYAKKPFGGPLQVLKYLGRYTHKVAITAHRIKEIDAKEKTITFEYKDYHARGTKDEQKQMTLSVDEFIRRYQQHILPKRYTKIRHYGYLKNHHRTQRLRTLFELLKLPPPPPKVTIPVRQRMLEKYGKDITLCPKCQQAKMELVATYRRGILCQTYEAVHNKSP
jgi:Putative transposase/Transposase zinc-binding domain